MWLGFSSLTFSTVFWKREAVNSEPQKNTLVKFCGAWVRRIPTKDEQIVHGRKDTVAARFCVEGVKCLCNFGGRISDASYFSTCQNMWGFCALCSWVFVLESPLHITLCSSGSKFSFGCDKFPKLSHGNSARSGLSAAIWSLCLLCTCTLSLVEKSYLNKVGAEHIVCLIPNIDNKIF